jgi:hypothetical protein
VLTEVALASHERGQGTPEECLDYVLGNAANPLPDDVIEEVAAAYKRIVDAAWAAW